MPIGTAAALTASNVTESGGTISSVTFYRESNGIPGLQIGSDTLVGAGTQKRHDLDRVRARRPGLAAGAYTYYAFATDASNVSSTPLATSLTVTPSHTAVTIASWNMLGQTSFGTQGLAASSVATGVTNSLGLTRGPGVSTTANAAKSNAWGGVNWADTSADGIAGGEFVTFGLTVAAGETLSLSGLTMNYRRSRVRPRQRLLAVPDQRRRLEPDRRLHQRVPEQQLQRRHHHADLARARSPACRTWPPAPP